MKCPKCCSKDVIKKGKRKGINRYFCHNCNNWFSSKRRPQKLQNNIFYEYVYKRQTLQDLATKYHRSIEWVRQQIDSYKLPTKVHNHRDICLVCDATFYGKKKDKLGTLVFKDNITKEIILWKHIDSEGAIDYKHLLDELLNLGYTIKSVTIDGKKGLYTVFQGYTIQMCHFHQKRTIQRPKLEASIELQKIVSRLKYSDEVRFTQALDVWHIKYKDFLNEKTISTTDGKEHFTHYKLVSAYKSLKTNLPYLFTYKKHKDLSIPNTTNALDGGVFSPLKILIKIHRGLSKKLKLSIVDDYLLRYKKNE